MSETCQKCNEEGDDLRTLWMACFYDMSELGLPFEIKEISNSYPKHKSFTLRVCKDCRAEWMEAIKNWFHAPIKRESCGSGIYVRKNGATIEVTLEEWEKKMTETKLDFELSEFLYDLGCEPKSNLIVIIAQLKKLCQAVDAINDLLDANTNRFIKDIQGLTQSVIKINEKLDKLNLENCNHTIKSGSILIDGKCTRCGEIA